MRDVDLVETSDASSEEPTPPHVPSFLARVRRHPRWLAAGAVVLVGLVGYQVVSDGRLRAQDDARAAALADVPLVLDPVDPQLPVLHHGTYTWDGDGPELAVLAQLGYGAEAAGVSVVSSQGVAGAPDVRLAGFDSSSGEPVWETPVPAPRGGLTGGGGWCSSGDQSASADATAVRCVVRWQAPAPVQPQDDSGVYPEAVSIVQVDATDGSVLHRDDLPPGALYGTGPWGTVVGAIDAATGTARLTLEASAWDGTARWTRVLDLPTAVDPSFVWINGDEEHVLVVDGDGGGGWVLSADDGTTVLEIPGSEGGGSSPTLLASGAVLVPDPAFPGSDPTSGEVAQMLLRPDRPAVSFDGDRVVWVGIDDGTVGDAILTAARAQGRDRGDLLGKGALRLRSPDGSVRWEIPGLDIGTALAVDGLVVGRTADHVVAVDARTGAVRWRSPVQPVEDGFARGLLTDGRVILVPSGAQLDAFTFRGERVWSVHVEADGDGHAVRTGPVPTASTGSTVVPGGNRVSWSTSLAGRLTLAIDDSSTAGQEFFVFGRP
ncbi:PQQ-binding-like beta-propeller repeat protein [Cellulomonas fimi]|uniref:Pyrrolo-quinoline quinone repeat-containing protein n=1 Tax=Cellulomonas fimi (strain ATCC 484 / DSM 20113 / JCM 1341 / CCUG 24087 / LMG 16345 / NBRC 15513 / NCIMB 8980 / NCTC 7547 / NRS-133) TaxID=590998 RepID=F4GZT4_CELFA|nr:PQQ-binding-like beta-propeller repeat protein [Cellulomonas fimi]AEE47250.1 Pyrrolo-quinoline quinone repeat-containing protein [Cellulomonas fimi ATCC 484]NNH06965.1 PQQ-binding-like beta-propeller repeat protein [Cellulomonas fimi]VEH35720.1 PQQ enzyme repeat [Cellulomonas fimi]